MVFVGWVQGSRVSEHTGEKEEKINKRRKAGSGTLGWFSDSWNWAQTDIRSARRCCKIERDTYLERPTDFHNRRIFNTRQILFFLANFYGISQHFSFVRLLLIHWVVTQCNLLFNLIDIEFFKTILFIQHSTLLRMAFFCSVFFVYTFFFVFIINVFGFQNVFHLVDRGLITGWNPLFWFSFGFLTSEKNSFSIQENEVGQGRPFRKNVNWLFIKIVTYNFLKQLLLTNTWTISNVLGD